MQKRKLLYTSLASLALATLASQTSLADELGTVDTLTIQPVETLVAAETGEQAKPELLTPEAPIAYSTEQSHADKITEVIRNRIQNGTLAFDILNKDEVLKPIIIEGEEGTKINIERQITFVTRIPRAIDAPKADNGKDYELGTFDNSFSEPNYSVPLSTVAALDSEVEQYVKTHQFFQPDQTVLSGLEKTLADYGLRLEVEDVPQPTSDVRPVYPDVERLPIQRAQFVSLGPYHTKRYRITGTLRRPEGSSGSAETSWKNIFYHALYKEDDSSPAKWNDPKKNPPTAPLFPGSDYTDLSYVMHYFDSGYFERRLADAPSREWHSINFGVEEIPLITTVKVKSAHPLADLYDLKVTNPSVAANSLVDPATFVTNKDDLPTGTQFTWVTAPDTQVPGTVTYHKIRATFSDGSQKEIRVRVTVQSTHSQLYAPEANSKQFSRNSPILPEDLIKNKAALPQGTRFSWSLQPNLTTPGGKLAKILITYPDGSFEEFTIRFAIR